MQPAPRGEITKPVSPSSGSLHIKSHRGPSCGISWNLFRLSIWSTDSMRGERPPCTAKMSELAMAQMGKKSKRSVYSSHTAVLPNLFWHSMQKPQFCVIALSSWFPRISSICRGYFSLSRQSSVMVYTLCAPLSTQSPRKRQLVCGSSPPTLNIYSTSKNCPCTSPTTVTGSDTRSTFFYSTSTSFSLKHRICIACASRIQHRSVFQRSLSTSKPILCLI